MLAESQDGFYPAHLAAAKNQTDVIAAMAARGANFNVTAEVPLHFALLVTAQLKRTPLHLAALQGHTAAVLALVSHGADKNASDEVCAFLSFRLYRSHPGSHKQLHSVNGIDCVE